MEDSTVHTSRDTAPSHRRDDDDDDATTTATNRLRVVVEHQTPSSRRWYFPPYHARDRRDRPSFSVVGASIHPDEIRRAISS